jgi:acetylornithine deacetylase/succinyl-diaminopimelate desuccinylase-like protein
MTPYLEELPASVETIAALKECILTNIVLLGQIPAPTFKEKQRATAFLERLAEFQVDECTFDGYRNPIGIIRGESRSKPPIFIVAHLDTFFPVDVDHNFSVERNTITGPGVSDNSASVGVLAAMPEIFRRLNLRFQSDIVLAGVIQSLGWGNLRGVRHLLKTWSTPIRGAVVVESTELGRLNYVADGMIRCEITCRVAPENPAAQRFRPNAILVLNEVINQLLQLRLPQRPRARVIIGKIAGGFKHGVIAYNATLGFEIQSDVDRMVRQVFDDIQDIVDGIVHEHQVDLTLKTISNIKASRLPYRHPLVKSTVAVMKALNLKPISEPSESELSIFLSRRIPAVTVGLTHGRNFHREDATIEIAPLFTGIAQVVGIIRAIDSGVCDDEKLA